MLDIEPDPFRERDPPAWRWRARVLGARIEFSSNSRDLLGVAQHAFAQVPQHRWPRAPRQTLRVALREVRAGADKTRRMPRKPVLSSGGGLSSGHVDARNFMIADPAAGRAVVQVDESLLGHPALLRYELIEFAAITLATRAQQLVSLHAGCVGARGRGVVLLGGSGSGKSTLALHAALGGLDFLAEDSVFVQPATLRATGLSAFVHAREDSLDLIGDRHVRRRVRAAPRIERRSGVRKHELDLRRGGARLAPGPLRIVTTVVLSSRRSRGPARLVPLTAGELRRELRAGQPFAAARPGWREFERRMVQAGGYRLDRVPPADAVDMLRELLA